jgi:DNA-binding CsgD family transcriptional regulator
MPVRAESLLTRPPYAGIVGTVPEDIPTTVQFVVDGHSLVAVPLSQDEAKHGPGGSEDGRVVGRIFCAGTRYVVYDATETALAPAPHAADTLTRRELQIAMLIGDGKSDKEIAIQLGISGYTVREHIRRVFAKLNVGRRAAIVSYILKQRPDGF